MNRIIKGLKFLVFFNWVGLLKNAIALYKNYKTILNMVAITTPTKVDDNALRGIESMLNLFSKKVPNLPRGMVAKKLAKNNNLIPELDFSFTEKEGFKVSTKINI